MQGEVDFVSFFRPGGRSFALRSCPEEGILMEKCAAGGLARGSARGDGNRSM